MLRRKHCSWAVSDALALGCRSVLVEVLPSTIVDETYSSNDKKSLLENAFERLVANRAGNSPRVRSLAVAMLSFTRERLLLGQ